MVSSVFGVLGEKSCSEGRDASPYVLYRGLSLCSRVYLLLL